MITRTFKLCLNAGTGSAPYINVSQYDEGETWLFELYSETGERYIPSTGAIVGVKSDGHGIINTGTVDNEGRVVITETQQMTASAGRAIFELSIDGLTHGTANFIVAVERKPTDEAVMSDSDLSLIQEAVDSAAVIVEVIGDSDPSEVIGEHVDDWLDNHPEATTTVQDGAITAPKLNSTLWDKLLVSEEASGAVASFDDGADDVPVSSLKVALEPIQTGSGDPSPSNVRPIIASNGKNMMPSGTDDTYTDNGITCVCKGGVYTLTGTSTGSVTINIPLIASVDLSPSTNKIAFMNTQASTLEMGLCRNGTRIHYWAMNTLNRVASGWSDSGNEVVDSVRFTVPNGVTLDCTVSPMLLLLADSNEPYQPYQGIMVERCGINQWDEEWENGIYNYSNGAKVSSPNRIRTKNPIPIRPSATYYKKTPSDGFKWVVWLDADKNYVGWASLNTGNTTFTTPSNAHYMLSWTENDSYGTTYKNDISINYPSTDHDYHAYTGNSYPYSLGQSVYGGTVDLATGVLTVDRASITYDGSNDENWIKGSTAAAYENDWTRFVIVLSNAKVSVQPITNWLKGESDDTGTTYLPRQAHIGLSTASYAIDLVVPKSYATDASEWKTYLANNPLQVVYELATPTTVQLTPQEVKTLLGYNNISSSGTVDVIYHADTKLYVDKMTNVDNAIIAPTEEGFTATRNYTVNDLVIVNDTLYKVTSNIATGSAITPNSNVTQTTLSALIKALS